MPHSFVFLRCLPGSTPSPVQCNSYVLISTFISIDGKSCLHACTYFIYQMLQELNFINYSTILAFRIVSNLISEYFGLRFLCRHTIFKIILQAIVKYVQRIAPKPEFRNYLIREKV